MSKAKHIFLYCLALAVLSTLGACGAMRHGITRNQQVLTAQQVAGVLPDDIIVIESTSTFKTKEWIAKDSKSGRKYYCFGQMDADKVKCTEVN